LRCGADLPPADPVWGGRPRQYCGDRCRKAGQRLRAARGGDWWRAQPWYHAWAAAEEGQRRDQHDRDAATERERDQHAQAQWQQREQQRRRADDERAMLESMPPHVRAGAEAARQAAAERSWHRFTLMTLQMDIELLSQKHARTLARTGQQVQLTRRPGKIDKLLWAAALAPGDAEAHALLAKARELAAKDPAQRPDAAIGTTQWLQEFLQSWRHDS
jgi:hypothetical protein